MALHIAESLSPEPEYDGGDREHRQVVGGSLFVARRDTAELFEAVNEAFDPVPFSVGASVERSACPLVRSVGDHDADAPATQIFPHLVGAVALVADESSWPYAWSPTSCPPHRAALHQRLEDGLLVALATREHEDERLAVSLGTHVDLGTEPATTPAQRLPSLPPFAPAAW
jgi:hypothetical protein